MYGWMTLTLAWLPVLTGSAPQALADNVPTTDVVEAQAFAVSSWVQTVEEADAAVRAPLCRQAHEATRGAPVDPEALGRFQAACPADFPVPAPPDFCLTGRGAPL
jgi:hypothetical protein